MINFISKDSNISIQKLVQRFKVENSCNTNLLAYNFSLPPSASGDKGARGFAVWQLASSVMAIAVKRCDFMILVSSKWALEKLNAMEKD